MARDEGGPRVVAGRANLGVKMLGQRFGQRAALFDIRAAFAAPTAQVTAPVRIQPIGVTPIAVTCVVIGIDCGPVNIERTIIGCPAFADQLVYR